MPVGTGIQCTGEQGDYRRGVACPILRRPQCALSGDLPQISKSVSSGYSVVKKMRRSGEQPPSWCMEGTLIGALLRVTGPCARFPTALGAQSRGEPRGCVGCRHGLWLPAPERCSSHRQQQWEPRNRGPWEPELLPAGVSDWITSRPAMDRRGSTHIDPQVSPSQRLGRGDPSIVLFLHRNCQSEPLLETDTGWLHSWY